MKHVPLHVLEKKNVPRTQSGPLALSEETTLLSLTIFFIDISMAFNIAEPNLLGLWYMPCRIIHILHHQIIFLPTWQSECFWFFLDNLNVSDILQWPSGVWDDDEAIDPPTAPCLEQHGPLRAVVTQVPALPSPDEHAGLRPRGAVCADCQAVQPPDAPQQADPHGALLLAQVRWRADAAHVWRPWVRALLPRIAHWSCRTVNTAKRSKEFGTKRRTRRGFGEWSFLAANGQMMMFLCCRQLLMMR